MSQQALYRKWRSSSFDELIGQAHVVQTLQNALASNRVAHAYIFSGPRGTGKTSSARILAKAVNCIAAQPQRPCNQCYVCHSITDGSAFDLIEIDAASNTQVDKIRDVIVEKVNFAPSEFAYKVYIIDEVHMLSNSAFNALLKTIEEPPAHAMFILATTEIHKIPATILSRCQRLDFRRISVPEVVQHLGFVLQQEGIRAEEKVLELVARQATGSMRDALSLLDQLLAHGGNYLTLQQTRLALGLASTEAVQALIDYILSQHTGAALQLVNQLIDQGTDPRQFLADILDHLRSLLLMLAGSSKQLLNLPESTMIQLSRQRNFIKPASLIPIIRLFNKAGLDLKLGLQAQLPIELAIVEAILILQEQGIQPAPPSSEALTHGAVPSNPIVNSRATVPSKNVAPKSWSRATNSGVTAAQTTRASRSPRTQVRPKQPAAPSARVAHDDTRYDRTHQATTSRQMMNPPSKTNMRSLRPKKSTQQVKQPDPSPIQQTPPVQVHSYPIEWWQAQWNEFKGFLAKQGAQEAQLAHRRLQFCRPHAVEGQELILSFSNFGALRIVQSEDRLILERGLSQFSQTSVTIRCVSAANAPPPASAKTKYQAAAEDPLIKEAIQFGGRIIEVYPAQTKQK